MLYLCVPARHGDIRAKGKESKRQQESGISYLWPGSWLCDWHTAAAAAAGPENISPQSKTEPSFIIIIIGSRIAEHHVEPI